MFTPEIVDPLVSKFSKQLGPERPVFVPVRARPGAEVRECFLNVQQAVDEDGGNVAHGWAIYIWPGVYIEAEHHAVWETPTGELVDVTPKADSEVRTLFTRNDAHVFDVVGRKRRDNARQALVNDPVVTKFLAIAAEQAAFLEQHSEGEWINAPSDQFEALGMRWAQAYQRLLARYLGPNDPCTCRSGRKVKKCCGLDAAVNLENLGPGDGKM